MTEWAVEEAPLPLRRSRVLAVAAFLLLLTSFWLPWWMVVYNDAAGVEYARDVSGLFRPHPQLTSPVLPHVSGGVAALATAWLFVRLAGRSWLYEPAHWNRDLLVVAAGACGALLSTVLWPAELGFWSGRRYSLLNATGSITQQAMPGLGWWCAALAVLLLAGAWALGRGAMSAQDASNPK